MRVLSKFRPLLLAFLTSACSQAPGCSSKPVQGLVSQIFGKQFKAAKEFLALSHDELFAFEDVSFSISEIITTSSHDRRASCKAILHTRFRFKENSAQVNFLRSLYLPNPDTPVSYLAEYTDDGRLYVTIE